MKNLVAPYPVGCLETGYVTAFKTCNNITKGSIVKKILPVFCVVFKYSVKKLAHCYHYLAPLLILLLNISAINAQQDISYALHANIIYRFTKYIDWPNYNTSGDFIIGIVGNTPLYDVLEDFIVNKTVGNRKIVIKKMSSSADAYYCNILFISGAKSKNLKKIAAITKGSPILIISETTDQIITGSCINFVIVNEHLKLEINKTNIEERNLSIASELLRLGTIVK